MLKSSTNRRGRRAVRALTSVVLIGIVAVTAACGGGDPSATSEGTLASTDAVVPTPTGPGSVVPDPTSPVPTPSPSTVTTSTVTTSTVTPSSAPPTAADCAAIDGYVPIAAGRRALVHGAATSSRRPALVMLHGFTGTPESIERTSGWTPFAREHQALVVYPEGTPVSGGGFAWTTGSARYSASGADDVAYLEALVADLVATACVDPARIVLAGESNGGAMTLLAACDARTRDRFALFAPVIPAVDQAVVDRCGSGPALSFTAVASRLDRTVPYDGVYPAGQIPLLGQEAWFLEVAARRNGCASSSPTRSELGGAEAIRPSGCAAPPTLVAVADGSHTWPGGPTGTGGLPPGSFPATSYLWDLFAGR